MIDLILPCLNEEKALPWVLSRVSKNINAIVVDNGSSDNSIEIAKSFGAKVIECEQPGYGAACHAGLLAASAQTIAFCDCDATIDPSVIDLQAVAVQEQTIDLAIARRIPASYSAMTIPMRIANRELARRIRKSTTYKLFDLGPLRIVNTQKYIDLNIKDRRSGYPLEMILRANAKNWKIKTFDIQYLKREGKSKVTGTLRGTINAIKDMNKAFSDMHIESESR
ncbi:MAG: glycosyltransferase family 2 protein [Acidimicrobiia bacterium]|nr:glycosyltransferase family 2 protein [Acidimicrobiia bacterium]